MNSIICNPSKEWKFSKEDGYKVDKFVVARLSQSLKSGQPFNLLAFINSIYDETLKNTNDPDKSLTIARQVTSSIDLAKQVFPELRKEMLGKVDPIQFETLAINFKESLDSVANALNDYRKSITPDIASKLESATTSVSIQPMEMGLFFQQHVPSSALTTSGNEIGYDPEDVTRDLRWYYDFLKHLGENNIFANEDGTITYQGKQLQIRLVYGTPENIPVSMLYSYERENASAISRVKNQLFVVFTDANGNNVFFNESYNLTDASQGKLIYFPLRTLPKYTVENGVRKFDLSTVEGTKIQTIASIAKRLGVTEDVVRQRYIDQYNELAAVVEYLKKDKSRKAPLNLTRISRGFIFRSKRENNTPLSEITNAQEFNPIVVTSKDAKGEILRGFRPAGVEEIVPFVMNDFPLDLAEKTADLLLETLKDQSGRDITIIDKGKIISRYIKLRSEFDIDFKSEKITLYGRPLSSDKATARKELIEFFTRTVKGKSTTDNLEIEFKNKLWFSEKYKGVSFIDFMIRKNAEGPSILYTQESDYIDWVKRNAYVPAKVIRGEIREENGYMEFDIPQETKMESTRDSIDKALQEERDRYKKSQESVTEAQVIEATETTIDPVSDYDDLLNELNRTQPGVETPVSKEDIIEGKNWYDNQVVTYRNEKGELVQAKLSDLIGYNEAFNIANADGKVRATWNRNGITLFKGSDYTDLYHEAWHGFTQWFLNADQKLELYNDLKSREEKIKFYKDGRWQTMNSKDLDFTKIEHVIYAEEDLAEKFRNYMLGRYNPKSVKQKSIFKKVLEFIKSFFGLSTDATKLDFSQSPIEVMFDKLRVGNLSDYTFSEKNLNAQINKLNQGITALPNSPSNLKNLNITDSLMLVDGVTDIMSQIVDSINKRTGSIKATAALFQQPAFRERVLNDVRAEFIKRRDALQAELNETQDNVRKQRIENILPSLDFAINEFGDPSNPKAGGLLKYYNDRTGFFDISSKSKSIDEDTPVNGDSTQELAEPQDREGLAAGSGNEFSAIDRMDDSVRFLLTTLFKRVQPSEASPEGFELNKLGFRTTLTAEEAAGVIFPIVSDSLTREEMYDKLVKAQASRSTSSSKYRFQFLGQLLAKLGNPENIETFTENSMWASFFHSFRYDKLNGLQINITNVVNDVPTGEYYIDDYTGEEVVETERKQSVRITTGTSDSADKEVGRRLKRKFELGKVTSPFIKRNQNNEMELDVAAVLSKYPTPAAAKADSIAFLKDLGIELTDTKETRRILEQGFANIITNVFTTIKERVDNRDSVVKSIDGKSPSSLFYGRARLWNEILQLESKYGGTIASYMIRNANNDLQSEMFNPSAAGVIINLLNKATHYDALISDPRTSHFSIERNPFIKASRLFKEMFGEHGYKQKRKAASGENIGLKFSTLLGTQALQEVNDALPVLLRGVKSAESDEQTAMLRDFFFMTLLGTTEAFRHADKTSAFVVGLDNGDLYHYVEPKAFLSDAGKMNRNRQLLSYLAAEIERIRKVTKKNASGENASDIILWGKKTTGYKTYETEGAKFAIFDDILTDRVKEKLLSIDEMQDYESVRSYLGQHPELTAVIQNQFNDYFDKLSRTDYNIIKSFGVIKADGFFNTIKDRFPELGKQSNEKILSAASEAFTTNMFLHRLEMSVLFYGDPGTFNHDKDEHMKRIPTFFATGRIPITDDVMERLLTNDKFRGKYAESEWFRSSGLTVSGGSIEGKILSTAVVQDPIDKSDYLDQMLKVAAEQGVPERDYKAYKSMESADGEAWVSFDAYRALEIRLNNWSDYKQNLYEKILRNEKVDAGETLKAFFPIKKFQYAGPLALENLATNAIHKYSVIPLIPTLIKGTRLESLHNKMVSQGIAYTVMHSGSKNTSIGTNGSIDTFYTDNYEPLWTADDYKFTKNRIFVDYLKEQLVTKDYFKEEIKFPTQMRKLITAGLDSYGVPIDYKSNKTGEARKQEWDNLSETEKKDLSLNHRLKEAYISSMKKMIDIAETKLRLDLGYKDPNSVDDGQPIVDLEKLVNYIKSSLTAQDLDEQSVDFLQLTSSGALKYPGDLSSNPTKIAKVITALVNKRIIDQIVPGEQYIQASGVGFEKFSKPTEKDLVKYGSNGLPFYYWEEGMENVSAMKIKIALHGNFKHLLKLKHNDDNVIGTIERLNEMVRDEEWLNKGEHRKMITLVGARIPTQGPNSMEFMEVFEFLPEEAGNIMVFPLEIVAKSGGDFDIDKMITMVPSIQVINNEVMIRKSKATTKTLDQIQTALDEAYETRKKLNAKYRDLLDEELDKMELTPEQKESRNSFLSPFYKAYDKATKEVARLKTDLASSKIDPSVQDWQIEILYKDIDDAEIAAETAYDNLSEKKKEIGKELGKEKFEKALDSINKKKESDKDYKKVLSTIKDLLLEKNSYDPESEVGNVMDAMRGILSRADNYINLTRPNSTAVFTDDPTFEDESISSFLDPVNRTYRRGTNVTNKLVGKKMSPTRIFENVYNTVKAAALYNGKMGVGMLATGNTFHELARQSNLFMEPFRTEEKKGKEYVIPQVLLLNHNTDNVNGQKVISLAGLKDYNLENYTADVISQLMNGYLDVAKDDWVYSINAIKQMEGQFEFMMLAGVPVKTAALMLAQPLVRDYLSKLKKFGSPFTLFSPEDGITNNNFAKIAAIKDVLLNNDMAENVFPKRKDGTYQKLINTPQIITGALNYIGDRTENFTDEELMDRLSVRPRSQEINEFDRQIFAQFINLTYMADQITSLKMAIRFDTVKNSSYFEASRQASDLYRILDKAFSEKSIARLLGQTIVGSFIKTDLIREAIQSVLPSNGSVTVNKAIIRALNNMDDLSYDEQLQFAEEFNNDLILYRFQNKLYSTNPFDTTYRDQSIFEEQILEKGVFFDPRTNTFHVDKRQIARDFDSYAFTKDTEFQAGVPATMFIRFDPTIRKAVYYKFLLEREYLRAMMPYTDIANNMEFLQFLTQIGNNQDIEKRYEEFIRNKALENLLVDTALFDSTNKQYNMVTFADKFLRIIQDNPQLVTDFPVLEMIGVMQSGTMRFLKLNSKVTDGTLLTAYKDQMANLSDANVTKVPNKELNKYISDVFAKMNLVGYLQAGSNTKSEIYMMSILDNTPVAEMMAEDVRNSVKEYETEKGQRFLETFAYKFSNKFAGVGRKRYVNYTDAGIAIITPQLEAGPVRLDRNKYKFNSTNVYVDLETGSIDNVKMFADSQFAGDNGYKLSIATAEDMIAANPDSTYVYDDEFPDATMVNGELQFKPDSTTPKQMGHLALRAGLATENSLGIPIVKQNGESPRSDSKAFEVSAMLIDQKIDRLIALRDAGKELIFPSDGLGNRLLGYFRNKRGALEKSDRLDTNPDLYLYLSKRLLKEFGYRNPMMLKANINFTTSALEGASNPLEMIQKHYKENDLQRITDVEVIDFLKTCKGI